MLDVKEVLKYIKLPNTPLPADSAAEPTLITVRNQALFTAPIPSTLDKGPPFKFLILIHIGIATYCLSDYIQSLFAKGPGHHIEL